MSTIVVALTPLETHLPCCCRCQILQAAPTHSWPLFTSQDPATRSSLCTHPVWTKWDEVILLWSTGGRGKLSQLSLTLRVVWPATTRGPWTGTTCNPSHLRGHHRGGHCDWTPPVVALTPLGTHTPYHCHFQMLWTLSKSAWGSLPLPRAMQLGAACDTFPQALATVKSPTTSQWLLALPIASFSLETHSVPCQGDIIIKMAKVKERILKIAKGKQSIKYKGILIRLSADFSTETLQARRKWQDIFRVLKGKNLKPRIL